MIEHQKQMNDNEIARMIRNSKGGKAELKKQLVQTLISRGHTKKRAQQLVKENWCK